MNNFALLTHTLQAFLCGAADFDAKTDTASPKPLFISNPAMQDLSNFLRECTATETEHERSIRLLIANHVTAAPSVEDAAPFNGPDRSAVLQRWANGPPSGMPVAAVEVDVRCSAKVVVATEMDARCSSEATGNNGANAFDLSSVAFRQSTSANENGKRARDGPAEATSGTRKVKTRIFGPANGATRAAKNAEHGGDVAASSTAPVCVFNHPNNHYADTSRQYRR